MTEFRNALEQNDRARKAMEIDLIEASDRLNEVNSANGGLVAHKRKLEGDLVALRTDLDDALVSNKSVQDTLHKSYSEVHRHADELKTEQVCYGVLFFEIIYELL